MMEFVEYVCVTGGIVQMTEHFVLQDCFFKWVQNLVEIWRAFGISDVWVWELFRFVLVKTAWNSWGWSESFECFEELQKEINREDAVTCLVCEVQGTC